MFTNVLAALLMALGVAILVFTFRKRTLVPRPPVIPGFMFGALVFFLGFSVMGFQQAGDPARQVAAAPVAPPLTAPAQDPVPTPDPVASVPDSPPANTDIQNLAVISGLNETDPRLTEPYARLQTLCPPANASVGDMVVSLQRIVREESGRDMEITDVMRQLATAQEGGAQAGMTCAETGGMLAELLIKGM